MEFDLEEFKERLHQQVAKGASGAKYISEEVHKAENLKVGLVEEIGHAADFVTEASNKIDTYVTHLHELAKQFPLADYQLDQRASLEDRDMQERLQEQVQKLEDEADPNAEGKISPLDLS